MALDNVYIPYGAYWCTPFSRWQASLAEFHSIKLAAQSAGDFLAQRKLSAESLDGLFLGLTVAQKHSFYGAPWLAGMMGAPGLTGPTLSQACATSARVVATAAMEIEIGQRQCILAVACDRTSNGAHIYYPSPQGPGGMGEAENPVFDNFSLDPWAKNAMIETAEKVAAAEKITREEQDETTLIRFGQYNESLADDRAFQRRYMIPVRITKRGKVIKTVEADEGIHPTTAEGLAKLRPVAEGGTVTFGTQTHPADGNAGMVICTQDRAAELSADKGVTIRVLGFAEARVGQGLMPKAVVPAARAALAHSGKSVGDCAAVKTHNPFAVNDVYFCREMGLEPTKINRYGSPLIWGHPQAPTGLRALIELIEQLKDAGGGVGLFSGCAAGDTAMAVVIELR